MQLAAPWIAAELGWCVAEVGRQPWVIEGVLPTFLAVSSISASNVLITSSVYRVLSSLAIVDIYLMTKAIRLGPDSDQWPTPEMPARQFLLPLNKKGYRHVGL